MDKAEDHKPVKWASISKVTGDLRFIILIILPLTGWGAYNVPAVKSLVHSKPSTLSIGDVLPAESVAPVTYDVVIKQLIKKTEANNQRLLKLEKNHP